MPAGKAFLLVALGALVMTLAFALPYADTWMRLVGALWILGHPAQAEELLSKFGWGLQFLALNAEPLRAYALAANAEEIRATQAEFI